MLHLSDGWQNLIFTVLAAVVSIFVVPVLKSLAADAKARAAKENATKNQILLEHLQSFLFSGAAAIAEKRFPDLARQILQGNVTSSAQVHAILQSWGGDLKNEAVKHFQQQDVDIAAQLGEKAIDRLIQHAADQVSPLPGQETSTAILQGTVARAIVNQGINFVKENAQELICKACLPPCETCPLKS